MNDFALIEIARAKIQHKDNDDVSINTLGCTKTGERAVIFTVRISDEVRGTEEGKLNEIRN